MDIEHYQKNWLKITWVIPIRPILWYHHPHRVNITPSRLFISHSRLNIFRRSSSLLRGGRSSTPPFWIRLGCVESLIRWIAGDKFSPTIRKNVDGDRLSWYQRLSLKHKESTDWTSLSLKPYWSCLLNRFIRVLF